MAHLLHEAVLDVDQDLARLSVALDEHVQRVTMLDPSEQTGAGRQGRDGICLDAEMPLGTLLVGGEQRIH